MSKKFCVILTKVKLFDLFADLVSFSAWDEIDSQAKGMLAEQTRNYYGLYLTKLDDTKAYQRASKSMRVEEDHKEYVICSNYRIAKRHFTKQLNKIKKEMKWGNKADWCLCLQVSKQGSNDFTKAYGYMYGSDGKLQKSSMPLPSHLDEKNDGTMGWQRY